MPDFAEHHGEYPGADAQFTTTHWSVVLAAGRDDSPQAREALETLCRNYWPPLYAYVRRSGHDPEEAQDLTQEFFARLLEKHAVEKADPQRGRFRTFLLTGLKHFMMNEHRRAGTQKRGGGQVALSLDYEGAEEQYCAEPTDRLSPDRVYEKRWATTLLERVLRTLQDEYEAGGKAPLYAGLKDYIWGDKSGAPYVQAAKQLGLTQAAVKVNVHRLRQRFRDLLRAEVAQTVAQLGEVDEELRHLITVFSA